jgi:hypothetical protein
MSLWGPPKNGVKSGKHCSYGHMAATLQKVCKIVENTKCRNVKWGFYCISFDVQQNIAAAARITFRREVYSVL